MDYTTGKFGLEIEFLCTSAWHDLERHYRNFLALKNAKSLWEVGADGSIETTQKFGGDIEFRSKRLSYSEIEQAITQFHSFMSYVKQYGVEYKFNKSCGFHIHVGIKPKKVTAIGAFKLFNWYNNDSKNLTELCMRKPNEFCLLPTIRNSRLNQSFDYEELYLSRYIAVNPCYIADVHNTIEFRQPSYKAFEAGAKHVYKLVDTFVDAIEEAMRCTKDMKYGSYQISHKSRTAVSVKEKKKSSYEVLSY